MKIRDEDQSRTTFADHMGKLLPVAFGRDKNVVLDTIKGQLGVQKGNSGVNSGHNISLPKKFWNLSFFNIQFNFYCTLFSIQLKNPNRTNCASLHKPQTIWENSNLVPRVSHLPAPLSLQGAGR